MAWRNGRYHFLTSGRVPTGGSAHFRRVNGPTLAKCVLLVGSPQAPLSDSIPFSEAVDTGGARSGPVLLCVAIHDHGRVTLPRADRLRRSNTTREEGTNPRHSSCLKSMEYSRS